MKHTRKRILSLLAAGMMTVSLLPSYLPASAYPKQEDYNNDPTDLTIDFAHSAKDASVILSEMRDSQHSSAQTQYMPDGSGDKETLDAIYKNYNHLPWRHVTNWSCNDDPWHVSYWGNKFLADTSAVYYDKPNDTYSSRKWTDKDGNWHVATMEDWYQETQAPYTLRGALESTDPNDTYVALADDADHEEHQQDPWEAILITTDKVLDLNGHTIDMQFDRNRENSDEHRQNHSKPETHYCWGFQIEDGATLTIIDSSAWRGEGGDGKGTGTIKFTAAMVNPFDWDIDMYTTRDLFYVNNGNLVIYGGTFQAGRRKVRIKDNFSWGKLKTAIGTAVEMGISIAEYSTGLNTATANYNDVLDKLNKQRDETAGNQQAEADGDLDEQRTEGKSDIKQQDGVHGNLHEEKQMKTPDSKENRNETIAEKKAEAAESGKESGKQPNQANQEETAKKEKGRNTQLAEAQNNIINKATDRSAVGKIVDSAFSLCDQIAKMTGTDEKSRVTQSIMGTVVKVGAQGSFISYGGTYMGYGSTPNTRNAVIELVNSPLERYYWDKTKSVGGLAYIYGGTFEGYCGANIFNFVRADVLHQTATTWCSDDKGNPKTVELQQGETMNLQIMYYENQAALDAGEDVDPIPINTANVQVRGGTFRCFYDLQNLAIREEEDGQHFRKFPGTPGMVNLGSESFGKELIQDGRIQISDCYGDGALVLMDERSEEEAGYNGLYHYRLFCSDLELRYKDYLLVYPNNNPKISASHSMALSTYYNDNKTSKYLFEDDSDKELEKERNNIRAPYRQTEYYFDVKLQKNGKLNYSVMPNFRIGGEDKVEVDTDYKGALLKQSEVWYYPEPLDAKGDVIKDFAYGEFFAVIPYHDTGRNEYIYDRNLMRPEQWAYKIKEDCWNDHMQYFFYNQWDNIRRQLHYFTYKVYRVDPLSRLNINEKPDGTEDELNDVDSDNPLITVRYGDSTDALKCKLPLDLLQEEIGKKKNDPLWQFSDGEMYRIVLETEEFVEFGNGRVESLQSAKTTTSILFRCYKETAEVDDTVAHLAHDFTPLRWSYNAYNNQTEAATTTTTTTSATQTTTTVTQTTDETGVFTRNTAISKFTGITGQIGTTTIRLVGTEINTDLGNILSDYFSKTTTTAKPSPQPAPPNTEPAPQNDESPTTTKDDSKPTLGDIIVAIIEALKRGFPPNAIASDSYATINLVNGEAGMVDYWGDKKIFDVYYQWWEVDAKGNPIRMFAGTDFVYNQSMGSKDDHRPDLWNFNYKNEDGLPYTFLNTVDPLDPNAKQYDTNGLPKRTGDWKWTDKQIHMYSAELTDKDDLKLKQDMNLSRKNNNVFATSSDTCYIPQEMAGKYIRVKAIVLNTKWSEAFDQKQTFLSHVVKVVDGHGEIKAKTEAKFTDDRSYATYEHPATLSVTELLNLAEGETVSYLRYFTNKGEVEFKDLNAADVSALPTVQYPTDFFDYEADDISGWESVAAHDVDFNINIITSKGGKVFRDGIYAAGNSFRYEVEAKEIKRWCKDEVEFKLSKIKSGEQHGDFCFSQLPKKASVGTWGMADAVSTNPNVAVLDENGRLLFGGEAGETTITFKGLKQEDITLKVRVIDDFDHFEISGIKPPVLGQKFDRSSPIVAADAPYEITKVEWYADDFVNSTSFPLPEDAVAEYYQDYCVRVFVKPKEGASAAYRSTYSMSVEMPDGTTEVISGESGTLEHIYCDENEFGFSYIYPALTDHEAKIVDKVTLEFPTEVKEGDNFSKWLESVKFYTNGYDEGFDMSVTPLYEPNACKVADAYGYKADSQHQINHFLRGVQNGLAAEIKIPYQLKWMGDKFADEVTLVINGEESKVEPYKDTELKIYLRDSINITDGDAAPVLPAYKLKDFTFVVGKTVNFNDLLVCDDSHVSVRIIGFKSEADRHWQDYFEIDQEKASLTPIKEAYFNWSDDLMLELSVDFDANGDGYPEYEDHHDSSVYHIYANESDVPKEEVTEKKPVKVKITVLDPSGAADSESEYDYLGSLDIIPVPDGAFVTGICDAEGKSVSGSGFKEGESYTVKTVSAGDIEIHAGADCVYAFFKDQNGTNIKDLQISADNAHFTGDDCITGLKPETDYTLYYRKGISGKVYTAKFRTAKQDYGVTVGRIPVTNENTGDLNTDGWHYDPETKTLTLKDFTLEDTGTVVKTAAYEKNSYAVYGGIVSEDDLTLHLTGENTIKVKEQSSMEAGVYGWKNLTVTGNGSLTLCGGGLETVEGNINLNGTGTLTFDDTGYALNPDNGKVVYTNGTLDCAAYYTRLLPSSKKDAIVFTDKVHDIVISAGEDAESRTVIKESELAEQMSDAKNLRIVPQHKDVNKTVADENYASGSCDAGCTYHLSCDCGHIGEETFTVKAEAHSLVKHDAVAADCKHTGTVEYWECERCGARFADEKGTRELTDAEISVPALGHVLVHKDANEATCTDAGKPEHWECSRCGECFADKDGKSPLDAKSAITPATGHDWIHYPAKQATCTADGVREHWKCANCGIYSADKDGTKLLTEAEVKIKALGHEWSDWKVSKEATADAEGEEIRSCSRCTVTEKRIISKKGETTTTTSATKKTTTTTTTTTSTTKPTEKTTTTTSTTKLTEKTTTTTSTTKSTAKITTTTSTTKPTTTTTTTTSTTKPTTTTTTTTLTTKPTTTTITTTSTTKPTTTTTTPTSTTKPTTTTTTTTSTTKPTTTTTTTTSTTKPTPTTTTTTTVITTSETVVSSSDSAVSSETTTTTGTTTPTEPEYLTGDINDDGEIGVEDAQLALLEYVNAMTGLDSNLTEKQKLAGDVNGDKEISVEDAQTILLYYVSNTLSGQNVTWDDLLGKNKPTEPLPFLLKLKEFLTDDTTEDET